MGDPKDWLELSMVNKKYHENLKIPISRKIMQLHIDDDIRRKVWPNFILPVKIFFFKSKIGIQKIES